MICTNVCIETCGTRQSAKWSCGLGRCCHCLADLRSPAPQCPLCTDNFHKAASPQSSESRKESEQACGEGGLPLPCEPRWTPPPLALPPRWRALSVTNHRAPAPYPQTSPAPRKAAGLYTAKGQRFFLFCDRVKTVGCPRGPDAMEDSSPPGLQLINSLSAVVNFLHSEGFLAAGGLVAIGERFCIFEECREAGGIRKGAVECWTQARGAAASRPTPPVPPSTPAFSV